MENLTSEHISSGVWYIISLYEVAITKLVLVLVIILIGFTIARFLGKIIKRTLHEVGLDILVRKAGIKGISLEKFLSKFATYVIYFIVFLMVLNEIGFTTDILHIISGAILVLLVLLISLAMKDLVPNVFAGFYIYYKDFIKEGDRIKVDKVEGKVKKITLVETLIMSKGNRIYIPNATLLKKVVVKKK